MALKNFQCDVYMILNDYCGFSPPKQMTCKWFWVFLFIAQYNWVECVSYLSSSSDYSSCPSLVDTPLHVEHPFAMLMLLSDGARYEMFRPVSDRNGVWVNVHMGVRWGCALAAPWLLQRQLHNFEWRRSKFVFYASVLTILNLLLQRQLSIVQVLQSKNASMQLSYVFFTPVLLTCFWLLSDSCACPKWPAPATSVCLVSLG